MIMWPMYRGQPPMSNPCGAPHLCDKQPLLHRSDLSPVLHGLPSSRLPTPAHPCSTLPSTHLCGRQPTQDRPVCQPCMGLSHADMCILVGVVCVYIIDSTSTLPTPAQQCSTLPSPAQSLRHSGRCLVVPPFLQHLYVACPCMSLLGPDKCRTASKAILGGLGEPGADPG